MPTKERIVDSQSIIAKILFDISTPLHLGSHATTV